MPFDAENQAFLDKRILMERELGQRSFYDFYLMAWPEIDSARFIPGKHIRVIAYHLQLAARREIRQLVICIPPRYSKSLLCSVAFPAWIWTWWPSAKFITCSYDQKLATRDSAAARRLVESEWYRERWPEVRLLRDQNQKMWYHTSTGGVRYVGSPSSGVTGHGSDFNIFDDPHNVVQGESEAERETARVFWFESMSSRFNNPREGVSLVIQQRVHDKDVAGECIRRGYYPVVLPARYEHDHPDLSAFDWRRVDGEPLWREKFDDDVLTSLWGTLKEYATAGQQQQRPTSREGGLFKQGWFEIIDTLPTGITWVRAWDLAGTAKTMKNDPDWTVGCKIGVDPTTRVIYIANIVRCQEDPGGVERVVRNTAELDGKDCRIFMPQDPGQQGKSQIHHYITQVLQGYMITSETVTGEKKDRADPLASQARAGNVKLYKAIWNAEFLEELVAFPAGGHDDQVDAAASGYNALIKSPTGLLDYMRQMAAEHVARQRPGEPSTR